LDFSVGPVPTTNAFMSIVLEQIAYRGWSHCLRISNGTVELVVTLDVGPRILAYGRPAGISPLKIFDEQMGGTNEPEWQIRGGHRLWLAPEGPTFSYCPDNRPVAWERLGDNGVRLTPPPELATGFQKHIDLSLEPRGTGVTLVHRLTRVGEGPFVVAPWALTVMAPGGVAIIPQPPFGEHPRDLLPNRRLVLWPYADLADPRLKFGRNFFTVRQEAGSQPIKLGLASAVGWAAYWMPGALFIKRFNLVAGAAYPDDGCNLEIFTNRDMLEVESLGPLVNLGRGESTELVERWELRADAPAIDPTDHAALDAYFSANPA
jgi:hypothetical protein